MHKPTCATCANLTPEGFCFLSYCPYPDDDKAPNWTLEPRLHGCYPTAWIDKTHAMTFCPICGKIFDVRKLEDSKPEGK